MSVCLRAVFLVRGQKKKYWHSFPKTALFARTLEAPLVIPEWTQNKYAYAKDNGSRLRTALMCWWMNDLHLPIRDINKFSAKETYLRMICECGRDSSNWKAKEPIHPSVISMFRVVVSIPPSSLNLSFGLRCVLTSLHPGVSDYGTDLIWYGQWGMDERNQKIILAPDSLKLSYLQCNLEGQPFRLETNSCITAKTS